MDRDLLRIPDFPIEMDLLSIDGMLYLLISFFFKVPTMLCIDTGQDSIFYVFNEQ